jgi:hypothetical protein
MSQGVCPARIDGKHSWIIYDRGEYRAKCFLCGYGIKREPDAHNREEGEV